jgi:hypothetical protein
MEITASNNGVWKDFMYCTDDRRFKIDLYNSGDRKEHKPFSSFTK